MFAQGGSVKGVVVTASLIELVSWEGNAPVHCLLQS